MKQGLVRLLYNFGKRFMGWTLHMIMCVLLCYPVSIRIYYQQGVLFLVFLHNTIYRAQLFYPFLLSASEFLSNLLFSYHLLYFCTALFLIIILSSNHLHKSKTLSQLTQCPFMGTLLLFISSIAQSSVEDGKPETYLPTERH